MVSFGGGELERAFGGAEVAAVVSFGGAELEAGVSFAAVSFAVVSFGGGEAEIA